ncbi:MAG: YfiR family protein [Planctomycetota bacterium]|jgi:hypothetical protein
MPGAPTNLLPAHVCAVGLTLTLANVTPGENTDHVVEARAVVAAPAQLPQNPKARAAIVRAMIILKIAPHLRFPDARQRTAPFRIGVVGKDLLANAIREKLPGKQVGKRKVIIDVIDPEVAAKAERRTHDLLYVATTVTAPKVDKIVQRHERLSTVLVCERAGFASKGGGIQLFVEKKKVRFEINQAALKKQQVRANPNLLKLSTKGPRK